MAFVINVVALFFLLAVFIIVHGKPLEESTDVAKTKSSELLEVAESQNPFLPRFAMRKLKEKREKARAQRRNGQVQSRTQHHTPNCPHYRYWGYYVSINLFEVLVL